MPFLFILENNLFILSTPHISLDFLFSWPWPFYFTCQVWAVLHPQSHPDIVAENSIPVVSVCTFFSTWGVWPEKFIGKETSLEIHVLCFPEEQKEKKNPKTPDQKWAEYMDCTVALTIFFDYINAEFRKMKNFSLIHTCSDWCISQGIRVLCPCSWCVLVPFPCADIFTSMWELHFNSELKYHILQV